jgi:hypothetical protein
LIIATGFELDLGCQIFDPADALTDERRRDLGRIVYQSFGFDTLSAP